MKAYSWLVPTLVLATASLGADAQPATQPATPPNPPASTGTHEDREPVCLKQVRPMYPAGLEREVVREDGRRVWIHPGAEIVVDFIVTPAGDVIRANAISATDQRFVEMALQAVRQWKFKPGLKNGVPVNTRMQAPIVFERKTKVRN